jgi:hypothetical protein
VVGHCRVGLFSGLSVLPSLPITITQERCIVCSALRDKFKKER